MDDRYPIFTGSYPFEGDRWVINIPAKDMAEAERRFKALAWAKLDGGPVTTIPIGLSAWRAWLVRLLAP